MVVLKIYNALIQAATCTLLNHNNEVKNWAIYNCTWQWPTSTCNNSFKLSEISDYPRLMVTCTFLTVCLFCIHLAPGRQTLIAVFNNMRTLKFKGQLTIEFFAAVNHNYGDSQWTFKHRNNQNGSKSTNHDWKTSPFDPAEVSFCFRRRPLRWLTAAKKR